MPQTLRFDIKLTKSQQKIYEAIHKSAVNEVVACMSRQSGKSIIAEVLCIEYLFKRQSRIGYIVPTFSHARKVYSEICAILPPEYVKSSNGTTLTIETIVGGKLQFFSAESPVALRGQTFAGLLIVDECAFISDTTAQGEDFFGSILFATRKAKHPKTLYISTPRGKQGFFYNKYMKGLEPHTNGINKVVSLVSTIYDDDLITKEEIKEIKESISDTSFRQEFLCEFLDSGLSAFSSYEDRFTIRKSINFNEPLWASVDFSSVGEDKTILTLMNRDCDVWQYEIGGSLDNKYKGISDILNKCSKLVIAYMESNSIGSVMINEVKKLTKQKGKIIEWTTTNESKENQVGYVQTMIDKDMIHFEENNTQLKTQFGVFTFAISKSRKVTYAAMAGWHDDRVLSLMMCSQAKEDYAYSGSSNMIFIKSPTARMSMR